MRIAIIGAGNIGGAAAIGFLRGGAADADEISVSARHEKSLRKFSRLGMRTFLDNVEAIKGAGIIFYAVKPWQMEEVIRQTAADIDPESQLVVSIAPGIKPDKLVGWFTRPDGRTPQIAYAIPNTAMEICESMTFLSPVTADEGNMEMLKELFGKAGRAEIVPVDKMLAGTAAASCGIAYAMRYISAASDAAGKLGLEKSGEAVCQTVRGAAALIEAHRSAPEDEIDKVTTPGGLTQRGLRAMERRGFSKAVEEGLLSGTLPKRRIVIKVGSNVLTRSDGALDTTRVSSIVDQIVAARSAGYDIVLVTSGAVACGRSLIRQDEKLTQVQQRQLYSALGQVRLMDLYYKLFIDYGVNVGQVLTQKKNFTGKREYANQSSCMEVMLQSGVIPIVNENDTVSIKELMFTDNDELSSLVARMIGAEALIILSNVDGIFTGDPSDPDSKLIPVIRQSDSVEECIRESRSSFGRGGMRSKYGIAVDTAASGIKVIIANGKREGIITGLLTAPESTIHTEFEPAVL